MIRVLLADDHALVRDGVRLLLHARGGFEVVAEAAEGREAVERAREHRPDVAILDLAMPGLNGVDATRRVLEASPSTRVVVLSMYGSFEHVARAFDAGAAGYVLKESSGRELIEALQAVNAGRRFLSGSLNAAELDQYRRRGLYKADCPFAILSGREREVLQLVVEGRTNAEVADLLQISQKTVETYRSRLMQKLGVETFAELVKVAIQHGITPPTSTHPD